MKKNQIKLIFNPHAGEKKNLGQAQELLPEILRLLDKYQIAVDPFPTKGPHDATKLAQNAKKEGYSQVIVVGGDGTTNEVANGLVGTDIKMGIIPTGTFMNIARMLSIPTDMEKAVELLKIQNVRKIDVGELTNLDGEKLSKPYYFIETSGIGVEAHFQLVFKKLEKGDYSSFFAFLKRMVTFKNHTVEIIADGKTSIFKANLVTVANGPFSGASLEMAPDAKLNDHVLTVVIYKHQKRKLLKYFLRMLFLKKIYKKELAIIKTQELNIKSTPEMLVHADATIFGKTPVHFKIKPACLSVICGFPENSQETHLLPKPK